MVFQCILQLLALQKSKRSCCRISGILTDAHDFVFILLDGKELTFSCDEEETIKIWENETWEDMKTITSNIYKLCKYEH